MASLRMLALLRNGGLAAGLALAMIGNAAAATFQITARSSGTGSFHIDGMFATPGPEGDDLPYTLRISTTVTDPFLVHSSATRTTWQDDDATVQVDLQVGGVHYHVQQPRQSMVLDYWADVAGRPYNVLQLYTSLWPHDSGNHAALWQTMTLPQGVLPFSDTLTPVALASPDILNAWVDGGTYVDHPDVFIQLGDLSAYGEDVSFTVSAVPEPAAYAMTLLGCAVLAGARALRARHGAGASRFGHRAP